MQTADRVKIRPTIIKGKRTHWQIFGIRLTPCFGILFSGPSRCSGGHQWGVFEAFSVCWWSDGDTWYRCVALWCRWNERVIYGEAPMRSIQACTEICYVTAVEWYFTDFLLLFLHRKFSNPFIKNHVYWINRNCWALTNMTARLLQSNYGIGGFYDTGQLCF